MKTSSIIKSFTFFIVFSFALVSASFAVPVGTITSIEGSVNVLKTGQNVARSLSLGDGIDVGDVLRAKSKSKAEITFINKNIMRIAPSTKVEIKEYMVEENQSAGIMKLYRGKVLIISSVDFIKRIAALPEAYKLEVHTENSIAGIRGSSMIVFYERGVTGVLFLTGKGYAYNPLLPNIVVPITAGNITFIKKNDEPPAPPRPASSAETILQAQAVTPAKQHESGSGTPGETQLPTQSQYATTPPGGGSSPANPSGETNKVANPDTPSENKRHSKGHDFNKRLHGQSQLVLSDTSTANVHLKTSDLDSGWQHNSPKGRSKDDDSHGIRGSMVSKPAHHAYDSVPDIVFSFYPKSAAKHVEAKGQSKKDYCDTRGEKAFKSILCHSSVADALFKSDLQTQGTGANEIEQAKRNNPMQENRVSRWGLFDAVVPDVKLKTSDLRSTEKYVDAQEKFKRDDGNNMGEEESKSKPSFMPATTSTTGSTSSSTSTPLSSAPAATSTAISTSPATPANASFVSVASVTPTTAITSVNTPALQPSGVVPGKIDIPSTSSSTSTPLSSAPAATSTAISTSPATPANASFVSVATITGITPTNIVSTMNLQPQGVGLDKLDTQLINKLSSRDQQHFKEKGHHHSR